MKTKHKGKKHVYQVNKGPLISPKAFYSNEFVSNTSNTDVNDIESRAHGSARIHSVLDFGEGGEVCLRMQMHSEPWR